MTNFKISLTLFISYTTSISAISLARSLQVKSPNQTFPTILLPTTNPLNVTAPTPPLDFSTHFKFNRETPLKPLEVYICAIELMSVLCNELWTSPVTLNMVVSGERASTEIALTPFPPPPYVDDSFQTRYAVWGLYQVGVAVAKDNNFYELDAAFYLGKKEIGWLIIMPKKAGEVNTGVLGPSLNLVNTTAVAADSGRFSDPNDKDFAITFNWDGVRIKAQDIFTAFMDFFATAAPHKNTDTGAYVPAARSESGDTVLSTWTGGPGPSDEMTFARLKRALHLIWHVLIIGRQGETQKTRLEGLIFGFEFKGKEIGAGRMLRFDPIGEAVGATAVQK